MQRHRGSENPTARHVDTITENRTLSNSLPNRSKAVQPADVVDSDGNLRAAIGVDRQGARAVQA